MYLVFIPFIVILIIISIVVVATFVNTKLYELFGCKYRHSWTLTALKKGDIEKCSICSKRRVCIGLANNGLGILDGATDTPPHKIYKNLEE